MLNGLANVVGLHDVYFAEELLEYLRAELGSVRMVVMGTWVTAVNDNAAEPVAPADGQNRPRFRGFAFSHHFHSPNQGPAAGLTLEVSTPTPRPIGYTRHCCHDERNRYRA